MIPGILVILAIAMVNWVAIARRWTRVEYVTKPLPIIGLFLLLVLNADLSSPALIFFGAGILLSMLGDILLLLPPKGIFGRWFVPGLVAFLLAQVAYIIGFNIPLPEVSPIWSTGIAVVLALAAGRVLRQIIAGVRQKGLKKLVGPVLIYGTVITLMVLSALLTIYRSEWLTSAAGLVALGAGLFFLSDILLAWERFVKPAKNGAVVIMVLYHLGQMGLVVGVILQFGR